MSSFQRAWTDGKPVFFLVQKTEKTHLFYLFPAPRSTRYADILVLARVDCIPLKPLVCFSGRTFLSLKEALRVLGVVFRKAQKSKKVRIPSPGITGEGEGEGKSFPLVEKSYEPSNMVFALGLRLGAESGTEGWYRVFRWWRDAQDIPAGSLKRFEAIAG